MQNRRLSPLLLYGLLALALVLWSIPYLVGHEPWNDEAYTFSLIYNVVISGDPVVPRAGGLPFMEKPPLYFVTAATAANAFASWLPLHDGARLINIVYLLVTVIALGYAARQVSGDRRAPVVAVVLFLGCLGIWEVYHRLITDVALMAGFTLAIAGLVDAWRAPLRAGAMLGTGAGMAFMAKGLFGPGQLGLVALVLPVCFAACRSRTYWLSMAWAALFALPWVVLWPLVLYQQSPALFDDWFWTNNIGRFTGSAGMGPSEKFGFYFYAVLWQAWPAIVLAAWQVFAAYRTGGPSLPAWLGRGFAAVVALTLLVLVFKVSKMYALPLAAWLLLLARALAAARGFQPRLVAYVAFAVPLVILSLASTSTDIYAIVLLPAVILVAVALVAEFPPALVQWLDRLNIAVLGAIALFVFGCWLALHAGFDNPVRAYFTGRLPAFEPAWDTGVFLLALLICAGWVYQLWRVPADWSGMAWRWTGGVIAIGLLFDLLWRSYIGLSLAHTAMIRDMQANLPADYDCIASFDIGESLRGMIHYRTGIIVLDEMLVGDDALECELRLLRENQQQLAPEGEWQPVWWGKRSGDRKEYTIFQRVD